MKKPGDTEHTDLEFQNDPELKDFLEKMKNLRIPVTKSKDSAWNEIVTEIEKMERPVRKFTPLRLVAFATAASVLLCIASWFVFQNFNKVEIIVSTGGKEKVILPDNSEVTLNAGSSLNYKKAGFLKSRKVNLKGEALFDVMPGGRFKVVTDSKIIEVLGTMFNIYSREDAFNVQCLEGRIKVGIEGTKELVLNSGEAVRKTRDRKEAEIYTFDLVKAASWTRGEFYYDSVPLNFVLDELERQFGVEISAENIYERIYTGYFKNADLNTALDNVCTPMSLHFEIEENKKVKIW